MSRITKFLRQWCQVQPYMTVDSLKVDYDAKDSVVELDLGSVEVSYADGVVSFDYDESAEIIPSSVSEPLYNDFGEIQYCDPIKCRCRKEISYQDVQTSNGSIVRSTARYILDDSLEIRADYRIDGSLVLTVSSYVGPSGKVEGYEVYV